MLSPNTALCEPIATTKSSIMMKLSRLSAASVALIFALSAGSAFAQDSTADTQTKDQARQNAPAAAQDADDAEKPAKPEAEAPATGDKPAAEKPSKDDAAATDAPEE